MKLICRVGSKIGKVRFILCIMILLLFPIDVMGIGSDGQVYSILFRGVAVLENIDAVSLNNDTGQGVTMIAPVWLNNGQQQNWSALVNTVIPDSGTFWALQNGIGWQTVNNTAAPTIVYTSSIYNLLPQTYTTIPYQNGHKYNFVIGSYSYPSNTGWQMCALDLNNGNYYCSFDPAVGTTLKGDLNTSVFFENNNKNANWYKEFNQQFKVERLSTVQNGIHVPWTQVHRHTGHYCNLSYPAIYNSTTNTGAIDGTGTNWGVVTLKKKGIPLSCP